MGSRIADSALYGHLWGTDELRGIFEESERLQSWLDILAVLAIAQAELGLVPEEAARIIAENARLELLDLDVVQEETRRTGHSTAGLITGLQEVLPPEAREWVYYGASVQDLTDSWTALAIKEVGGVVWRDLRAIEAQLLNLAVKHRATLMAGRTHGQLGSPITFGFKAAGWADEVRRHLYRLGESGGRLLVGQLGGGVGSLAFFGDQGLALRERFCTLLGLSDPVISWTSSRDRLEEFVSLLAMVASTLARIGNEIYQLQRPEIAELGEPAGEEAVSSITMPHKRNPERSEHLVTLGRLVQSSARVIMEGSVQEHERDGRAWKAEWVAFPEVCLLTGTALRLTQDILEGLEVDEEAMLGRLSEWTASERLLAVLAPRFGKYEAQSLLQSAIAEGREKGLSMRESLTASPVLRRHLDRKLLDSVLDHPVPGAAPQMVDEVVARGRRERAQESQVWP